MKKFWQQKWKQSQGKQQTEDMGLFTFYKEQEMKEEENRSSFGKTTIQKNSKFKIVSREYLESKNMTEGREGEGCEDFLRNVGSRHWMKQTKSGGKQFKEVKSGPDKQSFTAEDQIDTPNILQQQDKYNSDREIVEKPFILFKDKEKEAFLSKVLTGGRKGNIVVQISKKRSERTTQIKKERSPKKQKYFKWSKVGKEGDQDTKSLQTKFLQKVRHDQSQFRPRVIVKNNSIGLDQYHSNNQKYFNRLFQHFFIPKNSQNQAARILKQTFRTPNYSFHRERLKTEESSSSNWGIKSELKSISIPKIQSQSVRGDMVEPLRSKMSRRRLFLRDTSDNMNFVRPKKQKHNIISCLFK